jgi:quinol-cytochrome oxidoreductase complex cytochrome b subunit
VAIKIYKFFNINLNFIQTVKSHFVIYPIPVSINYFWNVGFIVFICIIIQILTGVILTLFYSVDNNYHSIIYILREVYHGYIIKYIHNNTPTLIFLFMFLHLSRSLYYNINTFNILTWYNGIILLSLVSVISYLGYVLAWGQISYWGATVILNLLHPLLVYLISGNYYITVICLRRFFIFHFILPFILLVFFIVHVYYLHDLGSSNPVSSTSPYLTNMMLFVIVKDIHIVINLFSFIFLTWDSFMLSHPDNLIYPDPLKTPIHIIPEWYFLSYYTLLKIIPSKNIGFMTMILVFLVFIALGDVYITPLTIYKPLLFFIIYLYIYLLWIGAQYPVPTYIYYGRVAYILFGISVLILTTPAAKVSHSRL